MNLGYQYCITNRSLISSKTFTHIYFILMSFSLPQLYMQRLRKLQREMRLLKEWRESSDMPVETIKDYEKKFSDLENKLAEQEIICK